MSDHVSVERAKHIRVTLDGEVVADSENGYVVHEKGLSDRYYVPRGDVRATITDGTGNGVCPWKGLWRHVDVSLGTKTISNGGWTYFETKPVTQPTKDFIAFYDSKFAIEVS